LRVLFFATFFEYRGAETYYTLEVNSLIKNYPEVEFLVYTVNRDKNRLKKYSENVLWVERKNLKNIKSFFLFLKDMVKIFTKFKPDIVHSVYVIESIITGIIAKIFRVPSIFHSRGMDFNYYPFISLKSNFLARVACKLNNIILTVSKSMKNDSLRLNVPPNKIIHIYDGVDFSKFNPIGKKFDSMVRTFQILHIGRFSYEKRHDLIIEACKKLREDNFNFHLTFIGIGELKNQIATLIKNYDLEDYIELTGWVDHEKLPSYILKMDLFILPSITEGLPISVVEAMSMGLCVVLTNVGGMPELAQQIGGILVEKNNVEQLYNAIIYYLKNPQDLMQGGNINREFIINNFNWDLHSKKLYTIYLKLINNKKFN